MIDSQEDALSDIPDYDGLEDEAFPPLPPPHSPGQQEHGELFGDAEEGEVSKLADVPAAKRKGVKRPQPKLDSQRLISERGLPALRTLFDDVHFRGKGHEAEDLKLLMQKMENWAHRLYPKLQFEDFIEKLEKLGSKKDVQTCLKRIRLDMPLTHEDFMDKEGEEEAPPEMQVFQDFDPFSSESSVKDPQGLLRSTPVPAPPAVPPLTQDQLDRMELNRQRALERRIARQQQTEPSDTGPSPASSNILNGSADQEKMQDLDLDRSCSTQPPALPHKDPEPPAPSHVDLEPPALPHKDPEPPAPLDANPEPPVFQHADPEPPAPSHVDLEPPVEPPAPPHADSEPPAPLDADLEPPAPLDADLEPPAPSHMDLEPPAPSHMDPEPPAPSHMDLEPPAPSHADSEPPAPPHADPEPPTESTLGKEEPVPEGQEDEV